MLELVVYFQSPQVQFSGVVQDGDVIARHPVAYQWLGHIKARQMMKDLNEQRCGYVILDALGMPVPHGKFEQVAT